MKEKPKIEIDGEDGGQMIKVNQGVQTDELELYNNDLADFDGDCK